MNAKDLNRAGHVSMGIAMVAAVVGALSLTSVPNAAFAGSDDQSSDDSSGSSSSSDDHGGYDNSGSSGGHTSDSNGDDSNDSTSDDNGGDTSGHGSDDVGYDDNGGYGTGAILPVLADVVADWETRGYDVLEISREDGTVVEMKVITPEGKRVEMYVDAATNTILSERLDY